MINERPTYVLVSVSLGLTLIYRHTSDTFTGDAGPASNIPQPITVRLSCPRPRVIGWWAWVTGQALCIRCLKCLWIFTLYKEQAQHLMPVNQSPSKLSCTAPNQSHGGSGTPPEKVSEYKYQSHSYILRHFRHLKLRTSPTLCLRCPKCLWIWVSISVSVSVSVSVLFTHSQWPNWGFTSATYQLPCNRVTISWGSSHIERLGVQVSMISWKT